MKIVIMRPRKTDVEINIDKEKIKRLMKKFSFALTPEGKYICSFKARANEAQRILGVDIDLWDSMIMIDRSDLS